MGGLDSGPGPGITLLIAIVLVLSQTASSAPLYEEDEGQESNSQAIAESHGCYYNFQHYNEGERILTNEPCLNCTCRNRMLMCYLRVCPFTKGIGQNCTVEKVPGQCCPIITCPEVPVQLLTSTTTEGIKSPDRRHGANGTAVGHPDTNGCNIDGIFYPNGAQVPGSPEKPCELCYCIRNKTACIMQECALHVDGCRPVYEEGQCFPVRYQCDDSPYEEEPTTTIRPAPTPGLVITTTSSEPLDCPYNNDLYEDGSRIVTDDPCEHCYCLKGKIACAVQECGAPLEKEGQNCTALPPAPGKCCPDSYQCDNNTIVQAKESFPRKDKNLKFDPKHLGHNDITMTSQDSIEGTTQAGIPSVADAGHPTVGYHPDQGTRTTEEPKHTTDRLHQVTETGTASKGTPDMKPQELDKGTQNESTENHLGGLHPMKPSSTSDYDQKITFPDSFKPSGVDRPEESGTKKPESDYTTEGHVIHIPHESQPHPGSDSHKQDVSMKVPEHPQKIHPEHPQTSLTDSSLSHEQNAFDPTTNDVIVPESTSPSTTDPLLDKLHNIIQDVQSQVSDGKTTEMPEQVDVQTTPQSQTGHFTEKPDILSHIPHFGSQPSSPGSGESGNTTSGSSPEDGDDIINKLQGIIQGIYSHVTDSVMSSKTPEVTTVSTDAQPSHPVRPESGSESLSSVPEKDGSKPVGVQRPVDTKKPSDHVAGRPKPEDESLGTVHAESEPKQPTKTRPGVYATEYPEETDATGVPDSGIRPQGSIKFPLKPKPGAADEPNITEEPEKTEEDSYATESPFVTDRPVTEYPDGETETPYHKEKYPTKHKPSSGLFGGKPGQYPDGHKPSSQYPEEMKPGQKHPDGIRPSGQYPEKTKPSGTEGTSFETKYPESATGRPEDYTKHPEEYKPGKHPAEVGPAGNYPEGSQPSSHYPHGGRPTGQPGQYPAGFKPEGQQYPEKTKPVGTEETPYATEYPENAGGKPGSPSWQYPEKLRPGYSPAGQKPSGQFPEALKPGEVYSEGTGHYPSGTEETPYGTEYPESATDRPEDYTKYPENVSGQYPDITKPIEQHPAGVRPSDQYPHGERPVGQYPEGYKPTERHPEYKPGQEGSKPFGQHPGYKPEKHPEGFKPEGQYPEEVKPGQQYPDGSKPGVPILGETKPFNTGQTSYGTEFPEGVTERPEDYTRYPGVRPSGQYPEGTRPHHKPGEYPHGVKPTGQYPEGFKPSGQYPEKTKPFGTEETPYGTEYPDGATERPEDYTRYPGVRPSGQYPEGTRPHHKPGEYPHGVRPTGQYPEGQKPIGEYPEKIKPFGTEYPEGATGRPEDYTRYPGVHPLGQYPEGTKPTGEQIEHHKPGQYPHGLRPTGQYPEKTKPFGTEETPYATEYPEGATGGPEDYTKYPESVHPEQKPEEFQPGQSSDGTKYSDRYPEGFKPTEQKPSGVGSTGQYPHGVGPSGHYPEGFKPTEQYPENLKPAQLYPEGSKPSGQYPDKTKPSGSEDSQYGTERPEGQHPEEFKPSENFDGTKPTSQYPDGERPTEEYPEKYKPGHYPGQKHPDGVRPSEKYPDEISSTEEYPEKYKPGHYPGQKHPDGVRPSEKYPDEVSSTEEYPEKYKPGHYPGQKYPDGVKPTEEYPEKYKPGPVQKRPDGVRPSGQYPDEASSTGEYPEKYKPGHYPEEVKPSQKYPDGVRPTEEYPEKYEPGHYPGQKRPEGVKPTEKYPYEVSSTGEYPEKYKPGHYPGEVKPGQKYPDGIRPTGQYPEKTKPLGTEDTPFSTEYPEGVTDRPEDYAKYPSVRPSGHYPEGTRPHHKPSQYPHGERPTGQYPEKTKPFGTEETPNGTEYPEGVTDKPEDYTKYPETLKPTGLYPLEVGPEGIYSEGSKPSPHYPIKTKPVKTSIGSEHPEAVTEGLESMTDKPESGFHDAEFTENLTGKPEDDSEYPAGSAKPGEGGPKGTEYPESSGVTGKPSGVIKHPQGFRPVGDVKRPVTKNPQDLEQETEGETYGTDNPEKFGVQEGSTKYPAGFKPGEPEGLEFSTKHPEGKPESGVSDEHSEETGTFKPDSEYPEGHKPGETHPDGSKHTLKPEDETTQHLLKPEASEHPLGKPQDESKYPETTGRPDDLVTKHPIESASASDGVTGAPVDDGFKPTSDSKYPVAGKYPEESEVTDQSEKESEYPHGSKYPETGGAHRFKPKPGSTNELSQTEYPETTGQPNDKLFGTERPEAFKPTKGYDSQYPDKVTKRPDVGTKYPDEVTGIEDLTGRPEYPEGTKPEDEETGTESGFELHPGISKRPQKPEPEDGVEHSEFGGITDKPDEVTDKNLVDKVEDEKYPQKLGGQTSHTTETLGVTEVSGSEDKLEGVTGKPEDINKYGDKTEKPEYSQEGSTESEHLEETYMTHYPEKPRPPTAEDQLLETGTEVEGLTKQTEKTKPETDQTETGIPLGSGTYGRPGGFTSPYYTSKRPLKPSETTEKPKKPDESKPAFPDEAEVIGKPQYTSKYPGKPEDGTKPDSEEKPLYVTGKPDYGHKQPEGSRHPSGPSETSGIPTSEYPGYPSATKRPVDGHKYPEKPQDGTSENENEEAGTDKPEVSEKFPQGSEHQEGRPDDTKYTESGVTGQPQDQTKYPEVSTDHYPQRPIDSDTEYPEGTGRPSDHVKHPEAFKPAGKPHGTEYPEGVTGSPGDSTKYPEELASSGHSPGVIGRPQDNTKYPGSLRPAGKPHDSTESVLGTEYPEGITDNTVDVVSGKPDGHTSYPGERRPTENYPSEYKPGSDFSPEHPDITGRPDEGTKYPESSRPTGEHTKYPVNSKPFGQYPGRPQGTEKYPEGSKPQDSESPSGLDYSEKVTGKPEKDTGYPVRPTGETSRPPDYTEYPVGQHPGRPHGTEKYPGAGESSATDSPYGTELQEGVTGKPEYSTKYSQKVKPYPEGSKPYDPESPYGTEYPEGATGKPEEHDEHPENYKPLEQYPVRPQGTHKYPEGSKPYDPESPYGTEYPEGVTGKPEDSGIYPGEQGKHPESYKPTGQYPGRPHGTDKHPGDSKPHDPESPYGTEYIEGVTGKPEGFEPTGEHEKYPESYKPAGQYPGRPHGTDKYPESSKPYDSESPYSTEYPEGVTRKPEEHGKHPGSYKPTGQHPGRPHGTDKYPEGSKPYDPESPYGTEYPEGVTGKPEESGKYPGESSPIEEHGKYPESYKPTGQYPGRPHGTDKYPEGSKPHDSDSPYGTKYPERVTGKPEESGEYPEGSKPYDPESPYGTEYPEGITGKPEEGGKYPGEFKPVGEHGKRPESYKPIGQYPGRPQGTIKYPEGSKPEFPHGTEYPNGVTSSPEDLTKFPGFGSTGKPQESFRPTGHYPGRPHDSNKHPEEGKPGSIYGTEYPEVTSGPEGITKYPEGFRPIGKNPVGQESGKPSDADSPYSTEYPEGVTGRPEDSTKYPEGFSPSGFYPGITGRPDDKSKHPSFRPTEKFPGSNVPFSTEYPEGGATDHYSGKPHVTDKYPEEGKPHDTEYPESSSGTPGGYTKYPGKPGLGFKPTASYPGRPHDSDKYPEEGKPGVVDGTESPEGVTDGSEDYTKLPEGLRPGESVTKHPEYPGKPSGSEHLDGVTGRPQDHTKHPEGSLFDDSVHGTEHPDKLKPVEGPTEYPTDGKPTEKHSDVNEDSQETGKPLTHDRPGASTKHPDSVSGSEYPDGIPGKYPGFKPTEQYPSAYDITEHSETETGKPFDGTESSERLPVTSEHPATDGDHVSMKHPEPGKFPVTSKHPEEQTGHTIHPEETSTEVTGEIDSKYPGSGKHPPKQKPEDIIYSTAYPEGSDENAESTEIPEPPKPSDSPEDDEHEGVTSVPEDSNLYPGISKRPTKYPQRPGSDEPQGSAFPDGTGKPHDESESPEETGRPKPTESEYGPHGTEYPEGSGEIGTEHPSNVEVSGGDSHKPHVSEDSEKPYETEEPDEIHSTGHYPEGTDRPHVSSKYPQRPKPGSETTEEFDDTGNADVPGVEKHPQYTQKRPQRPKPTDDEAFGSDDSTTLGPHGSVKFPEIPEPSTEYPDKSDVTRKPAKYPEESKPDDGEEYGTELPEKAQTPEETYETGIPESATGVPLDKFKPTGDHSDTLEVTKRPVKPSEHDSTDYPSPIELTGRPEDDAYASGITRKPETSSGIPTEELSTDYPHHVTSSKPGTAYLPLDGQLPNEKVPSSVQLGEDSVPEVSEHTAPTETLYGFTDRIPASGTSSEDLLNNLHHFESLPEKPSSADLTHDHQTPSHESTTLYPGQQPTSSSLPVVSESDQKPEDGTPGKPGSVVPGEGSYNEQDPTHVSGTTEPSTGTGTTPHPSTTKPGTKYPGSLHDPAGEKYPEVSAGQPEDPSVSKDSTTKRPLGGEILQGSTERHPEIPIDTSHSENLPTGGLTRRPVPSDVTASTPVGVTHPEEDSSPEIQKFTPAENDLINKLHNIISGIQSQVTEGKTTKLPQEGYDSTTPLGFPTESSTDKFGRPEQKPQDSTKPSSVHTPDSSADNVSQFGNEIYDQTTTYEEDTEVHTDSPESVYPFVGGSTEQTVGVPSKGPEGIRPDKVEGSLSTQSPDESKPAKPENVQYPKPEEPSPIGHPADELSGKPYEHPSSTESSSSGSPTTYKPQHSEFPEGSPHQTLTPDQESSSVKPDTAAGDYDGSTEYPHITSEVKDKKPAEDVDNLISEGQQPITQDTLHTVTPQDPHHKPSSSVSTDKPLHVVYPTYYPEGVVTRKPGTKPDGETDKKVTVTPESILVSESDSTGAPDDESHTIYEVQTEISSDSPSPSPVVVVQVHTETHSERATTKPETEVYVQHTTELGLESSSSKPQKPEDTVEGLTNQSESSGQTPQVIFGRPIITQPSGSELQPESQTLQPHSEIEKSPSLSTDPFNQESTTTPGLVTVTPISFHPTKESEHIMHLYSPKDKYPGSSLPPQYVLPSSTTEKVQTVGFTEPQSALATDSGATYKPEILGTRFPSRKTTQKPTDGVPLLPEGTTVIPTQGIDDEYQTPHFSVTNQPHFTVSTDGLPTEATGHKTGEETTKSPEGASYVPYKLINGTKVYYPEKETSQPPSSAEPSAFDGYDHIPYEIVNGTKFFYPNRVVTPQPAFTTTTGAAQMGMYVPYKIVNGNKVYYTQDKPEKPEKFDGLDYVPFDIVNGTKVFYPDKVTTTPPPSSAMYVPFKIINDTKVYYPKDAQDEPQNIPDEYDGFDYIPYEVVDGKKVFRPDRLPGHAPPTTERSSAMYVPYKLINGKKVYYPKDAQSSPESVPEGYDGFDFVPYEVVNGVKVFYPERVTPKPEQTHAPAMFVPYKLINGTKVYFPKYAQLKPTYASEGYDGFDYLPYEEVNGTKVFRPVTQKPEQASTSPFYPKGMFVPYKIIDNKKVFFPKDAQHKPRPLKPGYDGVQYLPFEIINGTKVFYPEVTTPSPIESSMYVPFKVINGTKVYYPEKATENPEEIPERYEGFDYLPFKVVNGNKVFYPERVTPNKGMYVPYKKVNGTKVYYPKDSTEDDQPVPEGYDGVDYIPYEIVNGTKVFYPDRSTTKRPSQTMFVPFKMLNGTKIYYPKDAQSKPYLVPEGYDGFDSLPYEIVNGTKVFHPEEVTERPAPTHSQGMFVPYKVINGTKVYYPQEAHKRPHPLSDEYAGLDYIPYDVVNGTKVFHPERVTPTEVPAMYVPYKLVNGTKVFYPKHAQHSPQKIPTEYDGFDFVPFEIVNGTQVFYPNRVPSYQGMYVPYKIINGQKVFYPKYAQHRPSPNLDGYEGFEYLPYENVNGTKVFRPFETVTETPLEQAMYVPYKLINGTKVFYPKYAQFKPYLIPEGYDGFDYIPYEIVNGTKVFDPNNSITPETTYKPALYVPYKLMNGKKVYQPKFAQQKPSDVPQGYDGFDLLPYDVVNGNKVFYPEQSTPLKQAMYVPYKIVNGTKVFYPKYAQYVPTQNADDFDGVEYVPYKVVNGEKVFQPEKATETFKQSMYVPYKLVNGIKVYQPKFAQQNPTDVPQGYDGVDLLPYDVVNGNRVFYPEQSTPLKQAMYVPYKMVNGTKVFYPKYAQYVPTQTTDDYDGFEYVPYDVVNGEKVFQPEKATETPFEQAMYVPYKVVNGTKVYYPKYAQSKPHLVPEGYDGFDYIPYDIVNGTKVFDPSNVIAPGTTYKPALYVPYKLVNGIKVYQPKFAQQNPTDVPQGYDGFDLLPYDVISGNKVFYPEQSTPLKQAMYVPYKMVNGTKVFYPKHAQYVPIQFSKDYDGFEYIPYEIVNGEKLFQPEKATETPFEQAMYVPYKVVNGTKVYYPKYAQRNPVLIPSEFEGFDYIPYEIVNGNKVFHPEQATVQPFRQAMYVPFRVVDGRKVYYPNLAQPKPHLIPEGYDGFDYLPYEVVNGTKVFDSKVPTKPTYLQGMYVPYKLSNNTKVFYPKDAHNKPNRFPSGYDGSDYVPYEMVNNTKMFYPELISTAQPGNTGSAGVYVPFKIINNKKVFYPKEATPFPPTVRHPYDGVAFVPNKALPVSEIVYVDNEEALTMSQLGPVPGEGSCYLNNKTFANNSEIPPMSPCQTKCICLSSVVRCVRLKCPTPAQNKLDCSPVYREGSCCPVYACGDSTTGEYPELHGSSSSDSGVEQTTPFSEFGLQKKPSHELGDVKGGKPGEESPSGEYHIHKPPKPKPDENESLEPYDSVEGQLSPDEDYSVEDEEPYGPGTCRYAGKVYVSAQQIPRDDPCDFCFCFRSDIICLQQSCPPPIPGCRDEPIQGFCCPRYECHVKMATLLNVTSTTTTTTTTLPPHFFPHAFKGSATRTGCFVQGRAYRVGQPIPSASGPCMDCICGGNGRMKCEPKVCTPEPMIRKMISPSENTTSTNDER